MTLDNAPGVTITDCEVWPGSPPIGGGPGAGDGAAAVPFRTAAQTLSCSLVIAACSRTLGCTIIFPAENCTPDDHRPFSTQNTSSGRGAAAGGTIRSLEMIRSCFPPLTSSPASNSNGFEPRLISTS